jgi:hypothetical protein
MFCFLGLELTSRPGTQGEFRFLTCDLSEVFDGSSGTDYQLIMCAPAATAPSCRGFTIDEIGAIMRHVRPDPPGEI